MATTPKTPPNGNTHSAIDGERMPRTPNERDESSDSGTSEPRDIIRQAHDDIESGKVGTDRGEATDAVYRDHLRTPKGGPRKP